MKIYNSNEVYLIPLFKFLFALLCISVINMELGYMEMLDNVFMVLIASLMCSFMPFSFITLVSMLFALGHFYVLGIETLAFGAAAFLLIYLVIMRFVEDEKIFIILLPIFMMLKIPHFIPVLLGLIGTPFSILPVACGVLVYYVIFHISANATILNSLESDAAIQKIRLLVDAIINDKEMIMVIIAFSMTVIVVYTIRRLSIDHAWTVAAISGYIINIIILLMGDLAFDTNISIFLVIFMSALSFLITKIAEFFILNLDYSRVEKVQFEDDEYYYYVKAVPKISLSTPQKKVKKINARSRKTSIH